MGQEGQLRSDPRTLFNTLLRLKGRPKTGATTRMMDDDPEVGGRRSEVSEPSSEPDFSSDF